MPEPKTRMTINTDIMRPYNYVCMPLRLKFRVISSKFCSFFLGYTCICTYRQASKQKSTAKSSLNFETSRRIVFIECCRSRKSTVVSWPLLLLPQLISVENPPCLVSIMILHLQQSNSQKSIWWRSIFVYEMNPRSHTLHLNWMSVTRRLETWEVKATESFISIIQTNTNLRFFLSLSLLFERSVGLSVSPSSLNKRKPNSNNHWNSHYATRNLDYFIINLGLSICLTYQNNFNGDSIPSYLLYNRNRKLDFKIQVKIERIWDQKWWYLRI